MKNSNEIFTESSISNFEQVLHFEFTIRFYTLCSNFAITDFEQLYLEMLVFLYFYHVFPEAYLESSRTSMMQLFCKNCERVAVFNYFRK